MKHGALIFLAVIALALAAGCGGGDAATTEPGDLTEPPVDVEATAPPAAASPEAPAQDPNALPADPQEVSFQAADGTALSGFYYPAASSPAPLVVMMHWVNGNSTDWNEAAPWLQNRGLANPFLPNPGDQPWWDPTWFPPVPQGSSYGVFIFNYRGCLPMSERGCPNWDTDGWLQDTQAAMLKAVELEGVDPTRIVTIGSSIGADGAVDGCQFLNEQMPGACQGALSLSPGGYLGIPYEVAVRRLGENQPQTAAWCLASESEIAICNTAADEGNAAFQAVEVPGGDHGNMLLRPALEPLPMQLILDFLAQTARG